MKYLVFDRDGTLINHVNYLCDPKKVELIDGVKSSLNKIHNNEKFQFFLHTNQSDVFRRYCKMDDVIKCNNRLLELLGFGDNFFSEICISIENPTISKSTTRKPSPLFGRRLIKRYSIETKVLIKIFLYTGKKQIIAKELKKMVIRHIN